MAPGPRAEPVPRQPAAGPWLRVRVHFKLDSVTDCGPAIPAALAVTVADGAVRVTVTEYQWRPGLPLNSSFPGQDVSFTSHLSLVRVLSWPTVTVTVRH